MRRLLRYLFPPQPLRNKVPYGYRRYSGESSVYGQPPETLKFVLQRMMALDVARTESDAYRLIRRHPDLTPDQIILKYRRTRKRQVLATAWRRFKALWIVLVILTFTSPARALAQDPKDVYGIVTAVQANVRSGPGLDQPVLGKLNRGAKFVISAISQDRQWLYFKFWDQDGYISINVVRVAAGLDTLPSVGQPARVEAPTGPQIVLAEYAVSPPVPAPGQPFDVVLTLRNNGQSDAGLFSLATTFAAGSFVYATVPKVAVGEVVQVAIKNPGEPKTGRFKAYVAIDVDSQLGSLHKDSLPEITYRIDRPILIQRSIKVDSYMNLDLHGGTADFALSERGVSPLHDSGIRKLDLSLADIHYDLLGIEESQTVTWQDLEVGSVFAIRTAEGLRGVLRVSARDTWQYYLYQEK